MSSGDILFDAVEAEGLVMSEFIGAKAVSPCPTGTNPNDWRVLVPFKIANPFSAAGGLGVIRNAGTTDGTSVTHKGDYSHFLTLPSQPADLDTDRKLVMSNGLHDLVGLKAYSCLYNGSAYVVTTTRAGTQTGGTDADEVSGKTRVWAAHRLTSKDSRSAEFVGEFICDLTWGSGGTRVNTSSRLLPNGAHWCDEVTIDANEAYADNVQKRNDVTDGAAIVEFDGMGDVAIILETWSVTANAGLGYLGRCI
jgi:hypothetical protein